MHTELLMAAFLLEITLLKISLNVLIKMKRKNEEINCMMYFGVQVKVIHTKCSKHCPSTVAQTFECVCSKINHGLNHGLFISLLKLINCPIH